jgi:RNA polymerase sigma factor for flagellar operon FliA
MRHVSQALGGVAAIFVTSYDARDEAADTAAHTTATPQLAIEHRERDKAVEEAMAALPEKERRLLQLYYYEDRPLEEAGKILGLSKSWSSRLHARAVELLKDELEKRAVTPERTDRTHKPRARR